MARILIVDDDEATSRLLELILADIGDQEITHAARGTDALAMLEAPAPDLLILDMHLPDMDGLTLLREARHRGYGGTVLVLTGSHRMDPLMQSLEAEQRPPEVLQKPFDIDDLTRRVVALLPETRSSTPPARGV